ncbi:MAG: HU family DNA-binding protein, partial [Clostridia bacterium]|nr:HU family DNA-binding protein [Clostridia bacterium]
MNKAELIAAIAAKTGETKKAAETSVNAFTQVVTEALTKGEKV